MTRLTLDQRRQLCQVRVTLNGQPAKISGAQNEYATVSTLGGTTQYQWAWSTVEYVCSRDGRFHG